MIVIVVLMTVMMAMIVVGMIMVMVSVAMLVMIMVMTVIVMLVIVLVMILRRHRGADRVQRPAQASRLADKSLALDPDQTRAEQSDQRVAGQFDHAARVAHLARGGVEDDRRDADECHRDERLQKCRGERQHDPAPPGLLVGDEIRRNHRLAVARPGGVEDTVQKRYAEQGPHGAAVGLGRADDARKVLVEFGLLGKNPADDAVGGWRRRRRAARRAERRALREGNIKDTGRQQTRRRGRKKHERDRRAPPGNPGQGHFTDILLENAAP